MQLHLQRPRKQHVAGHADDDRLGGDAFERLAQRGRARRDRSAIDRLAQQQERLDREALREAAAVMIEILGHRRPIETRHQLAEPRVELVAAAIGQHPELARAAHAGGDIAVARSVAHQLALQVTRRRAPAVGAQPRRDADQLRAAFGCRTAKATPTMPPRLAPTNVTASTLPQPSSHAATRSARPSTENAGGASCPSKSCQVEPLPGQAGTEHRVPA